MKIFGDVDKTKDGKVKSQYPAWYYETHIDELRESIRHKEYQLESDLIPLSEKGITRERLKQEKERLEEIEKSKAKFTATEKDDLSKIRKDLGQRIKDGMFTRSQMEKGLADAHEEARRLSEPVIEIKTEVEKELAKECEVKVIDGKVSRKGAEKIWKIASKALGEMSNTEELRKP
jgi:hypothetical protein